MFVCVSLLLIHFSNVDVVGLYVFIAVSRCFDAVRWFYQLTAKLWSVEIFSVDIFGLKSSYMLHISICTYV